MAKKLKELSFTEEAGLYSTNPTLIKKLRDDIQMLKVKEETMWKQQSHIEWLKEGDQNTMNFHCRANQLNKRNYNLGLGDDLGHWLEDEEQMGRLASNYFEAMFITSNPVGFDEILCGLTPTVTTEMNSSLDRPFIAEEVQRALHHMALLTAPRPDGMSPIFYKSFWHIVGKDVTEVVLNALNSGFVPDSLNSTFVTLIPKIIDPKKVLDLKPISLCNVVYKLIAKV